MITISHFLSLTKIKVKQILCCFLLIIVSQYSYAQADLAIQGASISPTSVPAGNAITATSTIYNLGNASTSVSNIGYYLSLDNKFDGADTFIGSSAGGYLASANQYDANSYRYSNINIPNNTPTGAYYILFVADYLNNVPETNEQNNISFVSFSLVPATVDLVMTNASIYYTSPAPGNTIGIETYISNLGNSTASSSNIGYYLSANSTLDNDDTFIGSSNGNSLIAGNYNYLNSPITIPTNTALGTYYIIAVVDYLNSITEINETNNNYSHQVNIVAPSADLVIQSLSVYNSFVTAGSNISSSFILSNLGNTTAPTSNVGIYLSTNNTLDNSDVFIGSSTGGSIAANSSNYPYPNFTIPNSTVPGSYYVLFVADYLNSIPEVNENNNISSSALTIITPNVDFVLSSFSATPSVSAGDNFNTSITLGNQGNTIAPASSVGYYLSANNTFEASDTFIGANSFGSIYAGYSDYNRNAATLTLPSTTTPGIYYLIAVADYLGNITENNENNNTSSFSFRVTASGTTFTVPVSGSTNYTTCSGTLYDSGGSGNYANYANGTITLNPATVGNKIRLIFSSFSVESCCDRLTVYDGTSTSAPLIGQYTSSPGTVYATNSAGALTLVFSTDGSVVYSGFEAEIACVTTVPLPDLTIQTPTASPTSLSAGMSLTAGASVVNQGTVTASFSNIGYYLSTNSTFEISDIYLGNSSGYSLSANNTSYQNTTLTIPANSAPGNYYVLFVADYLNNLTEDSETNNVASTTITVTAPAVDLIMLSAFTSASTLANGGTFSTSSFIANQGSTPAGSSHVSYYLSVNNTLDPSDISLGNSYGYYLTSGNSEQRSATLTLPASATAGNYYLLFVADFNNEVSETNESNNVRSVAVTVTSPNSIDLAMTTKFIETTTLFLGAPVSASGTILNNGNVNAPRSAVGFYLSTNITLDAADVLLNLSLSSGPLAPNATEEVFTTLTIPNNTAPGSYYILFQPDYNNQIAEPEENNGYTYVAVTVTSPSVDLAVQNQSISPSTLGQGNSMRLFSVLENLGNTSATNARTGYYLSTNTTLESSDLLLGFSAGDTEIPGGATSDYQHSVFTIPATTAPGAYYILFVADYNNTIIETNETNNVASLPLTVNAALPNLRIFNINTTPTTVVAGNLVAVGDSINNLGYAAAASSNIGYYLSANTTLDASDILLDQSTGGSLDFMANAGDASMSFRMATLTIPGTTAAGNYYILSVADYTNAVTEISETDNVSSVAISVSATNVDLLVQNHNISPANVATGNTINATANISNQGTTPAGASSVSYYLSSNTTFETSDVLLGTSTGTNLASGSSAYRTASLTIPANTSPGAYQILFIADASNSVIETNETNNISRATITIASPTSVDLVIQAPSGFPTTVTAGNNIDVSSFIYNQGVAAASASSVGYYLSTNPTLDASDVLLNTSTGGSLAANASANRSARLIIPANITAGTYYVLFVADQANAVAESLETNNISNTTITITAPLFADFMVQTPRATPASLLAGNSLTVAATIRNQGTATAASSVGYYLSANNTLDATDLLLDFSNSTPLEPSASTAKSTNLTIPVGTAPGNYNLFVVADYSNAVAESDEINNLNSVALTIITPTADITAQNQIATPASVLVGNTISVSSIITNQGNITASSGIVGYYLSTNTTLQSTDILLDTSTSSNLAAGGSVSKTTNLTIPAGTAPGNYYILFVTDHTNVVTETNEDNNIATVSITVVAPTVDLALQATALSRTTITAGDTVSVTTTFHNYGNNAASSSYIHYYLSSNNTYESNDVLLGSIFESAVAAGTSESKITNLIIPANTGTGSYYLLLAADATNNIAESNETNNGNNIALTISARNIDLAVQNPTVFPSSVVSGNTVTVAAIIANTGTSTVASSTIGYYLSTNNTLESSDILLNNTTSGTLAAGATAAKTTTLAIPVNTVAGSYYILFIVDHAGGVTETNELNNLGSASITITAPTSPDFTVQAPTFTFTSMNLVPGGAFEINTIISNQGAAPASSSNIGYYLSNDNTWDAADIFLNYRIENNILTAGSIDYSSTTITIPANANVGTYYLIVVADYLNSTAESNETNNTSLVSIRINTPSQTDLEMLPLNLRSNTFTAGQSFFDSTTVSYKDVVATASFTTSFYLSVDNILENSDILIHTGASSEHALKSTGQAYIFSTLTIPANTAPGLYYIIAVADYINNILETNENNNTRSEPITIVGPRPDLTIQSPFAFPSTISPNQSVTILSDLVNNSNITAYPCKVGYYLSTNTTLESMDIFLSESSEINLLAGGTTPISAAFGVPINTIPGTYYILIVADYNNVLLESNEANNLNFVRITVEAPPIDLVIQSPSLSKVTLHHGSTVTASSTIANMGTLIASSSNIGYYLSTDSVFNATDDIALYTSEGNVLAAGSSIARTDVLTIPTDLPLGSYYILYIADPTQSLTESSKTNNVIGLKITISLPTGIQKPVVEQEVTLFPNPTSEKINLSIAGFQKGEKEASVTIYNARGGKILTNKVLIINQKLTTTFDVSNLSRGMYMIQILAGENLITRQVVIE
jgi:subtilase family serine protease